MYNNQQNSKRNRGKSTIREKLDKLPQLKAYLYREIEAIEQFQKRRIKYVIYQMNIRREEMDLWKVIKRSGIKIQIKKHMKWLNKPEQILKNKINGTNLNQREKNVDIFRLKRYNGLFFYTRFYVQGYNR